MRNSKYRKVRLKERLVDGEVINSRKTQNLYYKRYAEFNVQLYNSNRCDQMHTHSHIQNILLYLSPRDLPLHGRVIAHLRNDDYAGKEDYKQERFQSFK